MIPVCRPRLPVRFAALPALALCAGALAAGLVNTAYAQSDDKAVTSARRGPVATRSGEYRDFFMGCPSFSSQFRSSHTTPIGPGTVFGEQVPTCRVDTAGGTNSGGRSLGPRKSRKGVPHSSLLSRKMLSPI